MSVGLPETKTFSVQSYENGIKYRDGRKTKKQYSNNKDDSHLLNLYSHLIFAMPIFNPTFIGNGSVFGFFSR